MLLIEQNLGVAIDVADSVAVLVNGQVARVMPAAQLAADRALQQRLLGVAAGPGGRGDRGRCPCPPPGGAARAWWKS